MKKYIFLLAFVVLLFGTRETSAASTFQLQKGWNLVSSDVLQEMEQDKNGLDELFRDGAALFGLNPVDKKYYGASGSVAEADRQLEKMFAAISDGDDGVASMGWWFYSPKTTFVMVDFSIGTNEERMYQESYHFRKGWNLIGITGALNGKSLAKIKGSCEFAAVYHFERGEWRKQTVADLAEKFTQDSLGYALAIKVMDDCKFSFAPTVPTLPSVPVLPE